MPITVIMAGLFLLTVITGLIILIPQVMFILATIILILLSIVRIAIFVETKK